MVRMSSIRYGMQKWCQNWLSTRSTSASAFTRISFWTWLPERSATTLQMPAERACPASSRLGPSTLASKASGAPPEPRRSTRKSRVTAPMSIIALPSLPPPKMMASWITLSSAPGRIRIWPQKPCA